MKKYEVSFDDTRYSEKPVGNEIGKINNRLHTEKMEYDKLAYEVGSMDVRLVLQSTMAAAKKKIILDSN